VTDCAESLCADWCRVVRTMTYMFFLIHLETCGYFGISAYVGLGTDEWVYDGTGTALVFSLHVVLRLLQ